VSVEAVLREIAQDWRIRIAAAADLLALVDVELAEMQATVDRI
jgi:hypothetical protein